MNYTCPYCNQVTTITSPNESSGYSKISTRNSEHRSICLGHKAISCPNNECKKLSLSVSIYEYNHTIGIGDYAVGKEIQSWNLLPLSLAKPQPDFIPEAITEDYYEACAILKLSPKASATLSRRCLQGIVRDFWDIPDDKRGNLGAELSYVKKDIDPDIWDGVQAIRSVGDIGAHMEKDVNYVVDVESGEAELLIELIEMLFEEWYISRNKRKIRAERAKSLSAEKLNQKREAKKASAESKSSPKPAAPKPPTPSASSD